MLLMELLLLLFLLLPLLLRQSLTAALNSAILFFRALNVDGFFFGPRHGDVPIVSSAILFAIGITIYISIGFIFLFLFLPWGVTPPPSVKKMRKIKPMAMSMVMPMAKRIALLIDSTFRKSR